MAPLSRAGRRAGLLALVLGLALAGCSRQVRVDAVALVGKWHSSRLATPLYLLDNGEWEIRKDDGAVLQYGIWEVRGTQIVWSIKNGRQIDQDVNEVLSASPRQWQVRERDGSVTTFDRLD